MVCIYSNPGLLRDWKSFNLIIKRSKAGFGLLEVLVSWVIMMVLAGGEKVTRALLMTRGGGGE